MRETFEGVVLREDTISYRNEGGPVAGARASVDTDGEVVRRFTATRLMLLGPFALAFKKKKDRRGLYLMVEGDGFAFVAECDPKKGAHARKFAALINQQGQRAAAAERIQAARATSYSLHSPQQDFDPPQPVRNPVPQPQISPATSPRVAKPAGWYKDPGGRYDWRFFDGTRWTEHCANENDDSGYTDPPG